MTLEQRVSMPHVRSFGGSRPGGRWGPVDLGTRWWSPIGDGTVNALNIRQGTTPWIRITAELQPRARAAGGLVMDLHHPSTDRWLRLELSTYSAVPDPQGDSIVQVNFAEANPVPSGIAGRTYQGLAAWSSGVSTHDDAITADFSSPHLQPRVETVTVGTRTARGSGFRSWPASPGVALDAGWFADAATGGNITEPFADSINDRMGILLSDDVATAYRSDLRIELYAPFSGRDQRVVSGLLLDIRNQRGSTDARMRWSEPDPPALTPDGDPYPSLGRFLGGVRDAVDGGAQGYPIEVTLRSASGPALAVPDTGPKVYLGGQRVEKLYLGDQEVTGLYLGSTQIA